MARPTTFLPDQDSRLLDAAEALLSDDAPVSLTSSNASVELPVELQRFLADIVTTMRRGQAVTFAPLGKQLTTQEAADLLGISRPTLIKLLESGQIPFEVPGRHRRIRLADLLTFQEARRAEQAAALDELARDAQDLELYDAPPDAFEAALAESRRKRA